MADTKNDAPTLITGAATLDTSGPADVAAAETFSPSGAPHQVTDFDKDHPAVDANPRANTTAEMNKIDFNDPTLSGADAVAKALGMKTEAEAAADDSKAKPKA